MRGCLWICLFLSCLSAVAQEDLPTLSLEECVLITLRKNRTLETRFLDRVSQEFAVKVAENEFGLTGTARLSTTNTHRSNTSTTNTWDNTANLSLTQKLKTGGSISFGWTNALAYGTRSNAANTGTSTFSVDFKHSLLRGAGYEVATANLQKSYLTEQRNIINLKDSVITTITRAITAYRTYILEIERLKIAQRSLERALDQRKRTEALVNAGRMARNDLIQNDSDITNRELTLLSQKNSTDSARIALLDILDIDRNYEFVPADTLETITCEDIPDQQTAETIAWEHRPSYLNSLISLETSAIDVKVARSNRRWDLQFTAGAKTSSRSGSTPNESVSSAARGGSKQYNVGLALEIPIGDLDRAQSVINAKINQRKSQIDHQNTVNAIELEIANSLRDIESKHQQVAVAHRATELSRQKLEIEEQKLAIGRSSNFEVINFQDQLVTAKNNELAAKIAYLNSLTTLDQQLGTTLLTWNVDINERAAQNPKVNQLLRD